VLAKDIYADGKQAIRSFAFPDYFIKTNSSDMLGCKATVSSKSCLVSPAFTAIAAA
jgi:hypothetical protein